MDWDLESEWATPMEPARGKLQEWEWATRWRYVQGFLHNPSRPAIKKWKKELLTNMPGWILQTA